MTNWVELRNQQDKALDDSIPMLWRALVASIDAAVKSFDRLYEARQAKYQVISDSLSEGKVTVSFIELAKNTPIRSMVISLDHAGWRVEARQNDTVLRHVTFGAEERSMVDGRGQLLDADSACKILLEEFLFNNTANTVAQARQKMLSRQDATTGETSPAL